MALVSKRAREEPRGRVVDDLPLRSKRPLVPASSDAARAVPASDGQLVVHVAIVFQIDGGRAAPVEPDDALRRHLVPARMGERPLQRGVPDLHVPIVDETPRP